MNGKNIKFNNKKVIFIKNKKLFKTDDIDVNKKLVSKKEPYDKSSFKYFVGYNDHDEPLQWTIMYKASSNDRIC